MLALLLLAPVAVEAHPAAFPSQAAQADTLWSEDWEGDPDWTDTWFVDGGTWEVGVPTSGPDSAYGGENVAATVLDGDYGEPVDTRLIRFTSFVVPAASENPRLRFWHWFSVADGDYGEVQISTDEGATWETISPQYTYTGSGAWTYPSIDLSSHAGSRVQVAFYFHSVCVKFGCPFGYHDVDAGWYVDNVALLTGPTTFNNPEGFEAGIGDWYAEAGTWEVGQPYSGPGSAHTGAQVAATVLGGDYSEPVEARLVSPAFVVPDGNTALRFWHWFSFADGDYGNVQIREEGGDWIAISDTFYSTSSNAWSFYHQPLSDYVGSEVQVAFYFHSVCVKFGCPFGYHDVDAGWYVDDVFAVGLPPNSTEPGSVPVSFVLHGAYPNPFTSATTIRFSLPEAAELTLYVFDLLGREVERVEAGFRSLGGPQAMQIEAGARPSGTYLYRLEARMAGRSETRSGLLTLIE